MNQWYYGSDVTINCTSDITSKSSASNERRGCGRGGCRGRGGHHGRGDKGG